MEFMNTVLHYGHWGVLVCFLALYVIFVSAARQTQVEISSTFIDPPRELDFSQQENFIRRMNLDLKSYLRSMTVCVALAALTLILFDTRLYVIAGIVCGCIAAAHFYQATRIQVRG